MKPLDPFVYSTFLLRHGFEHIGGGAFANVFAHPSSKRCIKIGRSCDSWPHYVLWGTAKRFAGGFAPKVYSLKYHGSFYVAVMERLVCTIRDTADTPSHQYRQYRHMLEVMSHYGDSSKARHLTASALKFALAAKAAGHANDLHHANFMIRHDGHLVITDPSAKGGITDPSAKGGGSTPYRIKHGYIVQH